VVATATTVAGCAPQPVPAGEAVVAAASSVTAPPVPVGQLTAQTLVPTLAEAMLHAGSLTTTTRTTVAGSVVENTVDIDMTACNTRLHVSLPDGVAEILTVDGRTFIQSPVTGGKYYAVLPDDRTWASLVLGTDPVRPVRALFGAVVSAAPSGEPVLLDGVPAQPYTVVVDTTRIRDGLGDLGAAVPRDQLPPTVTFTYWIDPDHRLRRATSELGGATVEMLFTNWGADFGLAAPVKEQLTLVSPA